MYNSRTPEDLLITDVSVPYTIFKVYQIKIFGNTNSNYISNNYC